MLENYFIQDLIDNRATVRLCIINGFQMVGRITHHGDSSIVFVTEKGESLVFKHSISTIYVESK